ncbi:MULTISPECIES: GntR family transcriptional regulator [unclassified Pseudonocardia]|uniref:GntR family transcriptional regulator n=1 Tax=unclassified Pseudonocardia TaxID=2619320 RepID=UPI000969FB4A|nr:MULTISPECIES: GntR family transcriptional regulator [unclassified Pseudonocardia]OJY38456.1 MAG: GntR family transcriptional regulator [Pseudonocardia sp. 73-21]
MVGRSEIGPRVLPRGDGSLWLHLLVDLRRRLHLGAFDDQFPGELALAEEYQVSRFTVRQALRILREEGVLVTGRGRAPRVAAPVEIAQRIGSIYSLFESVQATGVPQRSVVCALDVRRDGVMAARLGLEESTPLVYLERLRLAGPEPLALDKVWLPERIAAPLLDVDFTHTALYTEYARLCGVAMTSGEEHIRAVVPTPAEQELLGITSDVALFAIERVGCSDGRPVEWRHTLLRGDRFSVTADIAVHDGYRLRTDLPVFASGEDAKR